MEKYKLKIEGYNGKIYYPIFERGEIHAVKGNYSSEPDIFIELPKFLIKAIELEVNHAYSQGYSQAKYEIKKALGI